MARRTRSGRRPDRLDGLFKFESRYLGVVLVLSSIGSFVWAIAALVQLDLLRALAWIGLGIFLGLLGLGWWVGGYEFERSEYRRLKRQAGALSKHGRLTRTDRGRATVITDIPPPPAPGVEPPGTGASAPTAAKGPEGDDPIERD